MGIWIPGPTKFMKSILSTKLYQTPILLKAKGLRTIRNFKKNFKKNYSSIKKNFSTQIEA